MELSDKYIENPLDSIARSYNELHEDWKALEEMVRQYEFNVFFKHVKSTRNVLEVGLGDGIFTEMLAKNFDHVIAVDGSAVTIENVKKRLFDFNNIEYIHSLIETLDLDVKVDNIVLSHVLEHLEDPIHALRKLKSVMHADSVMYVSVPNAMSLHRQVAVKMGLLKRVDELIESDIRLGHKRVYKPEEFLDDIHKAGLSIIKWGGILVKPLSNKQIASSWTKEMINGFLRLSDEYPGICGEIYSIVRM